MQACAAAAGHRVSVLYANILLARHIGEVTYSGICFAPTSSLLGERFFAAAAYGMPALGLKEGDNGARLRLRANDMDHELDLDQLIAFEPVAASWADELTVAVAEMGIPIVGCTSTFEQTSASVALLRRLKERHPAIITIMGGANCEGEMADGIRSLCGSIDHVFSGESESTFPEFLTRSKAGHRAATIVQGRPCEDMEALPTVDYEEFYDQLNRALPDNLLQAGDNLWLPYETSRGCWWGQKHHCTFCGINGEGMKFREKSADKVIAELRRLVRRHPSNKICMTDNIMPHRYFTSLLARLGRELPGLHIFFEQKANLSFAKVRALKRAGIELIQPGIEALATDLLTLMRKGVTAAQNLALLRYARSLDVAVNWNILYAFPNDRREDYEQTLTLIPYLAHLHPPTGLCHLSIDRFSPYFDRSGEFGISAVRPMDAYADVLPSWVEHRKIAYHFIADYRSGSREDPALVRRLEAAIAAWRSVWQRPSAAPPVLELCPIGGDTFILVDTRGLPGIDTIQFLDAEAAWLAIVGDRPDIGDEARTHALLHGHGVLADGRFVPLATADEATFEAFLQAAKAGKAEPAPGPMIPAPTLKAELAG